MMVDRLNLGVTYRARQEPKVRYESGISTAGTPLDGRTETFARRSPPMRTFDPKPSEANDRREAFWFSIRRGTDHLNPTLASTLYSEQRAKGLQMDQTG
jgi:hypothetical protein